MTDAATTDGTRDALARATLVALYAMSGATVDFATAAPLWLPGLEPISLEDALRRLAAMPPAVVCAPFPTGRDIAIGAWAGREASVFKNDVLDLMRQDITERSPQHSPADYQVTVRGEAEGDVAQLSWAQYEQWMRDFELVGPTFRIDVGISANGAHAPRLVVTISPPSPDGWVSGTYL